MDAMAIAKELYGAPKHVLPPAIKSFLDSVKLGRLGLRLGRKVIRIMQKLQDPVQRRLWMRRFGLPLRNVMVLNLPITVTFDGISAQLVPQGATAGDIWAGLRCETQEITFILSVLEPGMVFFDVGANAGLFAICAAKKIGGAKVFAFEPCAST